MSESLSIAVILNPIAGRGRGAKAWPVVRGVFEAAGAQWSLAQTTAPGDAFAWASEAVVAGTGTVVAIGGDGTVNEIVNGFVNARSMTAPLPTLGVVPVGSGNDFAKPLGLPAGRPAEAARAILAGHARTIDVGRVNGRAFVNGVGLGLDGYVALEARKTRRLRGTAMYAVALLRALRAYRIATMRIAIDGEVQSRPITMVNVTNGPCHGGGFWICPQAEVDDGLLDVCIADAMGPLRVVPLALRVMRGTHVGRPEVSFATARRVTIETDRPLPAHVDGEILGSALSRLEIEVLPGRLRVLVPGRE